MQREEIAAAQKKNGWSCHVICQCLDGWLGRVQHAYNRHTDMHVTRTHMSPFWLLALPRGVRVQIWQRRLDVCASAVPGLPAAGTQHDLACGMPPWKRVAADAWPLARGR